MKRIVPLFLAALMVLTMVVTAAGFDFEFNDINNLPDGFTMSSDELYDREVEYLFAAQGTPTIDGTVEEAWANAFTFCNNPVMASVRFPQHLVAGWTQPSTISKDRYRFMWDENNLYILEERFDEKVNAPKDNAYTDCWSGGDQTNFNILLPTPLGEYGDAISVQLIVAFPYELITLTEVDGVETKGPAPVGTTAESFVYVRQIEMTDFGPGAVKPYVWDLENGEDGVYADVASYTTITETGYIQETVIPWSALAHGNLENLDYAGYMGGEFGVKIYSNHSGGDGNSKVYHVNQHVWAAATNRSDWTGHAVVRMVDEVSTYITPDVSWFNPDETVFEIADAADLLGLMYLTHGWNTVGGVGAADTGVELPAASAPQNDGAKKGTDTAKIAETQAFYDARIAQAKAGSKLATAGKTFKITADIDLNPGYTGAANTRPGNIWYGLLNFAGTLDGQGHTISGIYNDAMYNTDFWKELGFCNFLAAEGTIQNVTLTGAFITDEDSIVTDGVAGVKETGATVTNVTVTNLVCEAGDPDDYTVAPEPSEDESASSEEASSEVVSNEPASSETDEPTDEPTAEPTDEPTEEPTKEDATSGKADDKTEDKGCASVAGGAVVALLAIAAIPAICRKKED